MMREELVGSLFDDGRIPPGGSGRSREAVAHGYGPDGLVKKLGASVTKPAEVKHLFVGGHSKPNLPRISLRMGSPRTPRYRTFLGIQRTGSTEAKSANTPSRSKSRSRSAGC